MIELAARSTEMARNNMKAAHEMAVGAISRPNRTDTTVHRTRLGMVSHVACKVLTAVLSTSEKRAQQDAMNKPGEAYVDNETVRGKDCTAVVCT